MKKLLLSLSLLAATFAVKAQATTVIAKQDPALNQLGMHFWGNNDMFPSCNNDRGTNMYVVNTAFTTYNASGLFWLATPPLGTNIMGFNLDVDMGGGVHHGTPVVLCGLTTGSYPLTIGGVYTVTMDLIISGTTYTIDFR